MKIRFLTGPKAGQTDHVENNSTTQTLINLGHIEVVTEAPPVPLPVSFGIVHGVQNVGCALQAHCPTCKRSDFYVGRPDKETIASNFLPFLCAHFKGVEAPEETRALYLKAWRPVASPTAIARARSSQLTMQTEGMHFEVVDGRIMPVAPPKDWDSWKKV